MSKTFHNDYEILANLGRIDCTCLGMLASSENQFVSLTMQSIEAIISVGC